MAKAPISEELRKLILQGRSFKLAKGQIIQSTEDRKVINLLMAGFVKRYMIANDGSIGIQVVYGPGDIFPITQAFRILLEQEIYKGPEVYYYEAMTPIEIFTIDESVLLEGVKNDSLLYRDLMIEAGKRLESTLQGLENVTMRNSYKRVAHLLAYFANRFGEQKLGGIRLAIPLTHQDIANILSLTRETVSANMIMLRKNKLIRTEKNIMVLDLQKLQEEAFS
jgi:CRP-like cAMP-binding protein